jgi:hypothetical protein
MQCFSIFWLYLNCIVNNHLILAASVNFLSENEFRFGDAERGPNEVRLLCWAGIGCAAGNLGGRGDQPQLNLP